MLSFTEFVRDALRWSSLSPLLDAITDFYKGIDWKKRDENDNDLEWANDAFGGDYYKSDASGSPKKKDDA